MKIYVHNHFRNPQVIEATRLLVTMDNGTPLALVFDHGGQPTVCTVSSVQDPADFQQQLRASGILQAVQFNEISGPKDFSAVS